MQFNQSTTSQVLSLDLLGAGVLDLKSGTLDVANGLAIGGGTLEIDSGATLEGAQISVTGGTLDLNGGTLADVVLSGTLASSLLSASTSDTFDHVEVDGPLSVTNASLTVVGGLTVKTADGTGAGAISVGQYRTITFYDNQTLDDATVTLSGYDSALQQYTSYAAYQAAGNQSASTTLTFGAGLTIDATGSYSVIYGGGGLRHGRDRQ